MKLNSRQLNEFENTYQDLMIPSNTVLYIILYFCVHAQITHSFSRNFLLREWGKF